MPSAFFGKPQERWPRWLTCGDDLAAGDRGAAAQAQPVRQAAPGGRPDPRTEAMRATQRLIERLELEERRNTLTLIGGT